MKGKKLFSVLVVLLVMAQILSACAPAPTQTAPTQAATNPTEVKIAVLTDSTIEQPYVRALLQAFDRYNQDNPHGLKITYDVSENIVPGSDDVERTLRAYAETGKYNIIWAHGPYSDQVKNVMGEYPETMFVYSGSGNTGYGNNAYFIFAHLHECAYVLGVAAGMMTKTNVLGAVAGYPYEDVTDVLNGFRDGALSVNPQAKVKIAYIESWYDPPKAKETTYALIAAGADLVYAERLGPFEALAEKGLKGFGNYEDQYAMSPNVVVSSAVLGFDPHVKYILDEWWGHVVDKKPWNGTIDPVWFGMKEGGCSVAPFQASTAPDQAVQDAVKKTIDDIMNGTLKIQLNVNPPPTD